MIAFASLLLGLVVGPEPVELLVDDRVAWVELRLDGATVAELRSPPWSHRLDFGNELRPRELQAVAFDHERRIVGRARQWVNLPRPPAEASIVLRGGDEGRGVIAHLSWQSVVAELPEQVNVTFDTHPLTVTDPRRIALPDHDPEQLHFLRVELDFDSNVSTVIERVFGGSYADRLDVQLTAFPVALGHGAELPSIGELRGRLSKGGRRLEIVAAEKGPAEVVIVRDEAVRGSLNRIGRSSERALRQRARLGLGSQASRSLRHKAPLPLDHQVRFLWPFSTQQQERLDFEVLIPSQTFTARDGGLYWLLTEYSPPAGVAERQRLADAVAVAGLLAGGRNRRRAVVLVLSADAPDNSSFTPAQVRDYLRRLQIPLFVWSPDPAPPNSRERWGSVIDISSLARLEQAVEQLVRHLERQRLIWIDGVHLPETVTLAPDPRRPGDLERVP